MNVKRLMTAAGAAVLALGLGASKAHAQGIIVAPGAPFGLFHPFWASPTPLFVNPAPLFVAPPPVVVAPPLVVVTPPPVVVIPSRPLAATPDLEITGYKIAWVRSDSGIMKRLLMFKVRNVGTIAAPSSLASVTLGDESVTLPLKDRLKAQGGGFDRFGLLTSNIGGQLVRIYFDDLTYTAARQAP